MEPFKVEDALVGTLLYSNKMEGIHSPGMWLTVPFEDLFQLGVFPRRGVVLTVCKCVMRTERFIHQRAAKAQLGYGSTNGGNSLMPLPDWCPERFNCRLPYAGTSEFDGEGIQIGTDLLHTFKQVVPSRLIHVLAVQIQPLQGHMEKNGGL